MAGLFSPQREALGFDARGLIPLLVQRIVVSGAKTRSFKRPAIVMDQMAGQTVSAKTIERVVADVGGELAVRRDANPKTADALAEVSPSWPRPKRCRWPRLPGASSTSVNQTTTNQTRRSVLTGIGVPSDWCVPLSAA